MKIVPFLEPRMTGKRFEKSAIPLELLKDLAILEEFIVQVAKEKYLEDHKNSKRSPRGFTQGVGLVLTGVKDGSAIPCIGLMVDSPQLISNESQVYYGYARDSIMAAVAAADKGEEVSGYLSEKSLRYFDRLGRSMGDDEAIEFSAPDSTKTAKLTRDNRKKLIRASKAHDYTEQLVVRGIVSDVNKGLNKFQIQMVSNRTISAPLQKDIQDALIDALKLYDKGGMRVLLQGIARFNFNNRLLGFDSVDDLTILDPLDIPSQIEEMYSIEDGWLDGDGKTPLEKNLKWLLGSFERYYPNDLSLPYLYPTEEGGVQAEWSIGSDEITMEIDLEKRIAVWHNLNLETDKEEENKLILDEGDAWSWIVENIRDKTRVAS